MTDLTGNSGFLPTVIFTGSGSFTSSMRIAQLAAEGITGFYEANFADGITTLNNNCFDGDTKVVVITINKVTSIGQYVFRNCSNLRAITLDTATNPTTGQYLLTSIGNFSFQYCTSLRSLYIPDTVTSLGSNYLCDGCTSLEACVFGNAYTSYYIDDYCFRNCTALLTIIIPENITHVYGYAFQNCTSLFSVTFYGKPTIYANTFSGAKNDSNAIYTYDASWPGLAWYLPPNRTSREYSVVTFNQTGTLTSAIVNANVASNTSWWVAKINNATIIESACFRAREITIARYEKLVGIIMSQTVTTINYGAFENYSENPNYYYARSICNINGIYIPKSVTIFADAVLRMIGGVNSTGFLDSSSNSRLYQVVWQSGSTCTTIGGYALSATTIISLILPPSITTVGEFVIPYAWGLRLFNLFQKNAKSSLYTMNFAAFHCLGSSITNKHLYIPKSVAVMASNSGGDNQQLSYMGDTTKLYIYAITVDGSTEPKRLWSYLTAGNSPSVNNRFYGSGTIMVIANYYEAAGESLTGQIAFANFHMLMVKEVTIVHQSAFKNCGNLKSIAFDHYGGDLVLRNDAFYRNDNIGSALIYVYLNGRTTVIGMSAFRNTRLNPLFDLKQETKLQVISHAAFFTDNFSNNPMDIHNITVPASVKGLGTHAFGSNVVNLKNQFNSLSFESNIEFWGDFDGAAVYNTTPEGFGFPDKTHQNYMTIPYYLCICTNYLKNVSFLDTVDENGNDIPTTNTSGLLESPTQSTPFPIRYNKQTLTYPLKRFGEHSFAYNHRLQSVRIPDGVKVIHNYAFYDCYSIKYLYLPDTLVPIGAIHALGTSVFGYIGLYNQFGGSNAEVFIRINAYLLYQYASYATTGTFPGTSNMSFNWSVEHNKQYSPNVNGEGILTRTDIGPRDNYNSIYDVRVGEGVTEISGFNGMIGLRHVRLPSTLRKIRNETFISCTNLVNIIANKSTFPSLTDIGANAFRSCVNLTTINTQIMTNLTNIGTAAFLSCDNLTTFFIPDSLATIPDDMFNFCKNLTNVTFGQNPGIKMIGNNVFYRCWALSQFNVPSSVVSIRQYAFTPYDISKGVSKITFGGGSRLSSLGDYVFGHGDGGFGAMNLTNIVLPSNLKFTGINLFRNARSNFDIFVFPSKIDYISHAIFYQEGYTYWAFQRMYFPISITALDGPRKHRGWVDNGMDSHCIPAINNSAAAYMPSHMQSLFNTTDNRFHLYFSNTPTGSVYASYYKVQLVQANTGTSVTDIELTLGVANTSNADTTTQRHLEIAEGVTDIGTSSGITVINNVFKRPNVISINFPNTVINIHPNTFDGCNELVYVTFSDSSKLKSIGYNAFRNCSMIHDILLPKSLTSIGNNAFNGCSRLRSIEIPYNVTSLGSGAFTGCTQLTNVMIHEQLYNTISTTLGTYFDTNTNITYQIIPRLMLTNTLHPTYLTISQINNIYIYKRQTQLGIQTITFTATGVLTQSMVNAQITASGVSGNIFHAEFSDTVTSIGSQAFYDLPNVYSVAISKNITSIGDQAFYTPTSYGAVNYLSFHPDSKCTSIGSGGFDFNRIFDLVLPDSLTSIGSWAFSNSRELISVCIPKNADVNVGSFQYSPKLLNVRVPNTLSAKINGTYFANDGAINLTTLPTTYTTTTIPHYKLTAYSMPNGIVQNVFDSNLTYIDHLAYAYYSEIALYAEPQTQMKISGGDFTYIINRTEMPCLPSTIFQNSTSSYSNYPIYRSLPDYNVNDLYSSPSDSMDDLDESYLIMPGYSIAVYTNLYNEENLFTNSESKMSYLDNEYGKRPAQLATLHANKGSSLLMMYSGKMVDKIFI